MHIFSGLLFSSWAVLSIAIGSQQELHKHKNIRRSIPQPVKASRRSEDSYKYLNANTTRFAVNSTGLPDVNFDVGESYAGYLPITANASDENQLWFWFFPSTNPAADKEITLWLNGGPGCSSLSALFQENGPISWQSGTYEPVLNLYSWTNLTNMIWIDQPAATGYSISTAIVKNQTDVANQFMGFWKNFIETFSMQGYKVYLTGESFAGKYIPYIANGMLNANDTTHFNVKGIQLIDASIGSAAAQIYAPAAAFALANNNILNLNKTFLDDVSARADSCGFTDFFNTHTTQFPPAGIFPPFPPIPQGCDLWDDIFLAAFYVNPCFNGYHILDTCPYTNSIMGFPSLGVGPNNYFNRSDVKAALHVSPTKEYQICDINVSDPALFPSGSDPSVSASRGPLRSVIERINNTIIAHGGLDFILPAYGTLIAIQNLTWNGLQGFQTAPSAEDNFYVPYHTGSEEAYEAWGYWLPPWTNNAGAGLLGKTHTERGLTWVTVNTAGHQLPQYAPGAAYRMIELLLGRIDSLETVSDFTTQPGNFTGVSPPFK